MLLAYLACQASLTVMGRAFALLEMISLRIAETKASWYNEDMLSIHAS